MFFKKKKPDSVVAFCWKCGQYYHIKPGQEKLCSTCSIPVHETDLSTRRFWKKAWNLYGVTRITPSDDINCIKFLEQMKEEYVYPHGEYDPTIKEGFKYLWVCPHCGSATSGYYRFCECGQKRIQTNNEYKAYMMLESLAYGNKDLKRQLQDFVDSLVSDRPEFDPDKAKERFENSWRLEEKYRIQAESYKMKRKPATQQNAAKCPNCGSWNCRKLTNLNRSISFYLVGFGSNKIGKTFECNDCGYTW